MNLNPVSFLPEIPPTVYLDMSRQEKFKENIKKLSELDMDEYSCEMNAYTLLQQAIILGDVQECEQLVRAGVDVNETGNSSFAPLIFGFRNQEILELLFPLSSDSSQAAILSMLFVDKNFVLGHKLWEGAREIAKLVFFLVLHGEYQFSFLEELFQNLPIEKQKSLLRFLFWADLRDPADKILFKKMFVEALNQAHPEVKTSAGMLHLQEMINLSDQNL